MCWFLKLFLVLHFFFNFSSSYSLHPLIVNSTIEHENFTGISSFRVLNRRFLVQCSSGNPNVQINVTSSSGNSKLSDDEFVFVTVSGVSNPSGDQWVAMISPSDSNVERCPESKLKYVQTGDFSDLPLLCHYPVKAQYLSNDAEYLGCIKKYGKKKKSCVGNATLKFHVVNIRSEIEFVLFDGGFDAPCIISRSTPLQFANPNSPLYGHLSSIDSTAKSMKLTWVSGSQQPQQVQYANGKTQTSQVTTFTRQDMCSSALPSPAKDFGWHDPGFIHSAVMTGLNPSTNFKYRYGSDSIGWSNYSEFRTPPAPRGSNEVKFLAFGDMGKAPLDSSVEHYIQPGSISVIEAMIEEVKKGNVDSIFHIGDISYATGFLVEWDFFLNLITPLASQVSYMTAIGNHERDYINTGVVYGTPDSGGECGVAYETYFPMPTSAKDKPWYSIDFGTVHFIVMSTEHNWSPKSEQYQWMAKDMASVDRSRTPWLIFIGHRPMYSSNILSVDIKFVAFVEPLLKQYKVDLVLFGHVHNYERTCSVYKTECLAMPSKDKNGVDTYNHNNYTAPVHSVIGMAGFSLDNFSSIVPRWSLKRISKFGYARISAKQGELYFEFVNSNTRQVEDSFRIIKNQ
ncbi:nucleotide pyrophosphatase/phosphodiesterase-like [Euphorbia lathyris]|uniref:nucleotide pyrophosphatase/phosphodiesterase-like n=1 Tax=Euphorbia lathyris TaxID=212925 RepID=UPI0033134F4D